MVTELANQTTTPQVNGSIQFKDVEFHYPTRMNVVILNDFNLKIEEGKTTALVGYSGGGKSTIISLMLRFYDITAGAILLDGVDIRNIDLKYLRTCIALVQQEPVLFQGTIFENLSHGKDDITEAEAKQLLLKSGLDLDLQT